MELTVRCPYDDYSINLGPKTLNNMVSSCEKIWPLSILYFHFSSIPGPLEAPARLPKINVRCIIWGILMHVNSLYAFLDFL